MKIKKSILEAFQKQGFPTINLLVAFDNGNLIFERPQVYFLNVYCIVCLV